MVAKKRTVTSEPLPVVADAQVLNEETFLAKYRFSPETYRSTGLKWRDLQEIFSLHVDRSAGLLPTAQQISERLRGAKQVHSLKFRIKDPEHLVAKIIRKTIESPSTKISPDNYRDHITDLIGIRVLHLYKEDWTTIHDFIVKEWKAAERPTANIRRGDPEDLVQSFRARGSKIKEHKFGYRSIHYLVRSQPTKEIHVAEIQVRTIFEEGWSEIDHSIRYPNPSPNRAFSRPLAILNRLAGSADEMGSYVRAMDLEEASQQTAHHLASQKRKASVDKIAAQVDALGGSETARGLLKAMVTGLASLASGSDETDGLMMAVRSAHANQKFKSEFEVEWLSSQDHQEKGLVATVVMGPMYGTQRSMKTLSAGEPLVVSDAEDDGLDAYDLLGKRVGRLQNVSPLEYDVWAQAMRTCYGSRPWRVRAIAFTGPEVRNGHRFAWVKVKFVSRPLLQEGSRRSRRRRT
jgi:putative GTP pyrophosphokinase